MPRRRYHGHAGALDRPVIAVVIGGIAAHDVRGVVGAVDISAPPAAIKAGVIAVVIVARMIAPATRQARAIAAMTAVNVRMAAAMVTVVVLGRGRSSRKEQGGC